MKFTPNKNFAENHLKTFIEKNILDYTKFRNFDYGPEKRNNISENGYLRVTNSGYSWKKLLEKIISEI